jgi:transposase
MANKRLSLEDIQQMKTMVQKGVAPEDIAKHFSIAISSVHNYKNRFKAEGMNFPTVRGKRPTGSVDIQSKDPGKTSEKHVASELKQTPTMESSMNFVVNGVTVHVSAEAKEVNISKNNIEINF